jgi:hypothetical protein
MKTPHIVEASCPLEAVDRRLRDAHTLWHQAEAAYFDPDGFRLAVGNAIQTLRSVTFVLQNHKAIIPNFDEWYGDYVDEKHGKRGKWQARLHDDPLMRWMVEARNKIEKRGDLESHSFVRAEIIASHLDGGPRIDVPAYLFGSIEALLRSIPHNILGQQIRRNGVLRIERRWIENTLKDYELLDAVAIYYGKIAELVHDAHRQMRLDPPHLIGGEHGESFDRPAMGWRFPCMIGHEVRRALTVSLADGSKIEFEPKTATIKRDPAKVTALLERYGRKPFEAFKRDHKTDASLAAAYFAMARALFLRDGYHVWILILLRNRKPVKNIELRVESVQQKYLVMRQMADEVTKFGADTVILISEAWQVSAGQLKAYERPADSPVRIEVLALSLVSKSGEPLDFAAKIVREGEKVTLGDTQVSEKIAAFEFASFYKAWGRPVPQVWMAEAIMARKN